MDRYLRSLAIGTLAYLAVLVYLTRPEFTFRGPILTGVPDAALTITAMLLTSAIGILGLVVSAQRGQRPWGIAFLLLSAYTPVLYTPHPAAYYATLYATFKGVYIVSLLDISVRFLPSAVLALLALAYGLRMKLRLSAARPTEPTGDTGQ